MYVDDNQYVKAGTLLAQIDPKDYQVALESAKATLANDEATPAASQVSVPLTAINTSSQLMSAQADVSHAQAGVSFARSNSPRRKLTRRAEANHAKAQDDVNRYKQLVDKHEIADQQYTQAVETAKAAAAAVDGAQAATQVAQEQVSQAQAKLKQAWQRLTQRVRDPSRYASRNPARWPRRLWWPSRKPLSIRRSSTWTTPASWRL